MGHGIQSNQHLSTIKSELAHSNLLSDDYIARGIMRLCGNLFNLLCLYGIEHFLTVRSTTLIICIYWDISSDEGRNVN